VIVIGASSGIGRATALRFAARGERLVLAARSRDDLDAVAAECRTAGAAAVTVAVIDVLDRAAVDEMVVTARTEHGRIDVVVFSAGVMGYGTIEDVPATVFERVVDTAVHGTASVARAVLPVFREQGGGTFIIVTSLLASIPLPEMGAYITGKWGQLALARVLQLETKSTPGVHVCTVAPGAVDTPIYRSAANFAGRVGNPPPPVATADRLAAAVVRCADRPRRTVSVGWTNPFIVLGFRLAPAVFDRLAGPLTHRVALRSEAVGPTEGNVFDPAAAEGLRSFARRLVPGGGR
jgi:short-subunit dehydrogenase